MRGEKRDDIGKGEEALKREGEGDWRASVVVQRGGQLWELGFTKTKRSPHTLREFRKKNPKTRSENSLRQDSYLLPHLACAFLSQLRPTTVSSSWETHDHHHTRYCQKPENESAPCLPLGSTVYWAYGKLPKRKEIADIYSKQVLGRGWFSGKEDTSGRDALEGTNALALGIWKKAQNPSQKITECKHV